ncbi:DNA-binding CsgD family transcriptional regulator [Microbacterium sp. BE35]|uniref:MEDS domain-containing protein n=1 Tax=Microbacterium sp. BE35 TaxID=2817773 RepID=UPI002860E2ED|nr:MEDS domain-containing protein [Microbacterium sp. BE35]MDR7189223.1 DNA-binding CsgD family transcriptional regulator [Microbacterium sp. BE35]
MSDLLMGIPGVGEVYPGVHVCALFSGPVERDRLLVQFLQEGVRHGDQCACFIDEIDPASMRQRVYGGAGHADDRRSGRIDLHSAPDAHLNSSALSPQQRISDLVSHPASSADDRRPLLRAAGQTPTHASGETGAREIFSYESAVIRILAELPAVFLCLYDVRHFGMGVIADVLKVHSRALLGGIVLYNPHGVAPTAPAVRAHEADPWRSLTGTEIRVAGLVGTGMTNRATAVELIVSPHTVDAHLKHIYQKLGIHSRAELAVLSFRHGSPDAQRLPTEAGH